MRDALPYWQLLPILHPGSRATRREVSSQVRGERCRSSAARANRRKHRALDIPMPESVQGDNHALRRLPYHVPRSESTFPASERLRMNRRKLP